MFPFEINASIAVTIVSLHWPCSSYPTGLAAIGVSSSVTGNILLAVCKKKKKKRNEMQRAVCRPQTHQGCFSPAGVRIIQSV